MKKLAIILFLVATIARADIIDLNPGGSSDLTPEFLHFINEQYDTGNGLLLFFDEMRPAPYTINGVTYPAGWVSQFGVLNGGTYFFSNLDQTGPVPTTTISWDMTGSGFCCLRYVLAESFGGLRDLFLITKPDDMSGSTTITIDGHTNIDSLSFYGRVNEIPDSGTTIVLLIFALLILAAFQAYNATCDR